MNMQIPKIQIKYARFLDPASVFYCKNNPDLKSSGWNDWTPPAKDKVLERIENYKKEWSKYEKIILKAICDILEMNFKQNIIDVYIVSGNPRQFSDPIIIKSGFSPNEFVDTLTHELIHKLFQNNVDIFPWKILPKMFPSESNLTRNHIITYAVLKYIYLDVLNEPHRLERNLQNSKKHRTDDYTKAWKIVEKRDYIELINQLKGEIKKWGPAV